MKKMICYFLCISALASTSVYAAPESGEIAAKSYILMEADSGSVLSENNADERLPIASVTKIMTMLLITEALDSGRIKLDDMVSVSRHAMDMGGSTMFLEEGEQLCVSDMLKGIAVASANDGCVAMAEFLEGSDTAFVAKMNQRAAELGMSNTSFVNTNGLDDDNHYSSARDVAVMSRELLKHDVIFNYTTIWTDSLRDGKFGLANTNKLIRFYDGANGLKTGSTSKAGCCLSATAKRNDMQLIAVILGAPSSKERFAGARKLLDTGFASYKVSVPVKKGDTLENLEIKNGVLDKIPALASDDIKLLTSVSDNSETEIITELYEIKAPVYVNDKIGTVTVTKGGETVGSCDLLASQSVEKKSFFMRLCDSVRSICFR